MSPQQVEAPFEGYNGGKEQRESTAEEGSRDKELNKTGSYDTMNGEETIGTSDRTLPMGRSVTKKRASNQMSSGPAPAVEKGGEDEFVRVSHLASVELKAVPTLGILKKRLEPQNLDINEMPRKPEDSVSLSSRSSAKKLRRGSNHKKYIDDGDDTLCGQKTLNNEDLSVENIVDIKKSPYEPGACAEKGESIFEEMKMLLLEDDENSRISQIFGPTNAGCLVKASSLIEKSGMLYSQTWTKGSIRGNAVGIIPNHLLLMVLVSNRFVKASELLLSGLCRDLEVYDSVNRGLDDWGWNEDYISVRATSKNYKFKTNKRDCFKCAIFVARTHSNYIAFGRRELTPSLILKLKACLNMMEAHLVPPSSNGNDVPAIRNRASTSSIDTTSASARNAKKRKSKTPEQIRSISSSSSSTNRRNTASTSSNTKKSICTQDATSKSKRKRPQIPKHTLIKEGSSSMLSPLSKKSNGSSEEQIEPSSTSKRRSVPSSLSRVRPRTDNLAQRRVSSSHSVPSLHMLMSQFEDRYKEMGQRYAEMGELLAQMKSTIEVNRERSEKEIRRELLDEIQRNILESIPKR